MYDIDMPIKDRPIVTYQDDKRLPAHDPFWGYVIEYAAHWGTDDFDFLGKTEKAWDHLWDGAKSYIGREVFTDMARQVIARDDIAPMGFHVVKYGGSPGGDPFAECVVKRWPGGGEDAYDFVIMFGLTSDNEDRRDTWFVQVMDDRDLVDAHTFDPDVPMTAERLAGYIVHYYKNARGY